MTHSSIPNVDWSRGRPVGWSAPLGSERINAGEASGFLIIPEGFMTAFLEDEPVRLTLKTNPAQTILPGIMQDVTEILLDLGFYTQAF